MRSAKILTLMSIYMLLFMFSGVMVSEDPLVCGRKPAGISGMESVYSIPPL